MLIVGGGGGEGRGSAQDGERMRVVGEEGRCMGSEKKQFRRRWEQEKAKQGGGLEMVSIFGIKNLNEPPKLIN